MLTHRNLVANTLKWMTTFDLRPEFRMIAVAPFFHSVGLCLFMHALPSVGMPMVVLPRFDLEAFLETIQRYRITHAFAVPPIVQLLAKHPLVAAYDLSSLE